MTEKSLNASGAVAGWLPEDRVTRLAAQVLIVLAGTALLAISAKIKVPFYPVPMTLQTLAILTIASAFGARLAVFTVLAYLGEGLLGLPVFTNTPPLAAGPAYFVGPTGGFLAGFVAMAAIVGAAVDRGWDRSVVKLTSAMLVGEVAMMVLGLVWLAWFASVSSGTGFGLEAAFAAGVAPFLLADVLKIALVGVAWPTLRNAISPAGP